MNGPRERTFSAVIQSPHLGGIGEHSAFAVQRDRIAVPRIPVPHHDFDELFRPIVTQVVFEVLLLAEIGGLGIVERGDDVPGGAACGELVKRREYAGDVERLVIGRRVGRTEAQTSGGQPHRHQRRRQIQFHGSDAVADRVLERVVVAIRHRQPVVEESEMKLAVLQDPPDPLVEHGPKEIRGGLRVAPGAGVVRAVLRLKESDQGHLAVLTGFHSRRLSSEVEGGQAAGNVDRRQHNVTLISLHGYIFSSHHSERASTCTEGPPNA